MPSRVFLLFLLASRRQRREEGGQQGKCTESYSDIPKPNPLSLHANDQLNLPLAPLLMITRPSADISRTTTTAAGRRGRRRHLPQPRCHTTPTPTSPNKPLDNSSASSNSTCWAAGGRRGGGTAVGRGPGRARVVGRVHRVGLGAAVGGDAVWQSGGVLAGDEDAADHEVELDWVQDAVAVVGHLGDRGEGLGLVVVFGKAVDGAIEELVAEEGGHDVSTWVWWESVQRIVLAYLWSMRDG